MSALIRTVQGQAAAYANWGKWVVRCPWCTLGVRDDLPFGTPAFDCLVCGATVEVFWPSEEMRAGVERLLMMRPDPTKRNWRPGETLEDLIKENGDHGVFSDLEARGVTAEPGGVLLSVEPGRIVVDELPALKPRHRLELPS